MVYICVFEYEYTSHLGVMFHQNQPSENTAPGVKCVLCGVYPDDVNLQNQLLDYLNSAFPGNNKNIFNTSVKVIEKLVMMISNKPLRQQQQQQQQQPFMPVGYIVPRPTRNDESEFTRQPVSSFSFANHVAAMPFIQKQQDFTITPGKVAQQHNFKMTQNNEF